MEVLGMERVISRTGVWAADLVVVTVSLLCGRVSGHSRLEPGPCHGAGQGWYGGEAWLGYKNFLMSYLVINEGYSLFALM